MTLTPHTEPLDPTSTLNSPKPKPWWRESYLWLVLMGPICVVIAALWTGYVAMMGSDERVHLNVSHLNAEQIRHNHMTSHSEKSNEGMLFGLDPAQHKE